MFGKKKSSINRQIVGFTKARKFLFFTLKPKPIYKEEAPAETASSTVSAQTDSSGETTIDVKREESPAAKKKSQQTNIIKNLGPALIEIGMKVTPEQYIKDCNRKAMMAAGAAVVIVALIVYVFGLDVMYLLAAPVVGIIVFFAGY